MPTLSALTVGVHELLAVEAGAAAAAVTAAALSLRGVDTVIFDLVAML